MSIGTTGLKALRVDCIVGIYPHEREAPQPLFVDVEVDYDFAPAAKSDAIEDALDYDALAQGITNVACEGRFALLEALVESMAEFCLQTFGFISAVRLQVRKPNAVEAADSSFVRIERHRR